MHIHGELRKILREKMKSKRQSVCECECVCVCVLGGSVEGKVDTCAHKSLQDQTLLPK